MRNLIVILFIVFALVNAPLAQAAGLGCQENCQVSEQASHSKGDKQDNSKLDKSAHHCCFAHAALKDERFEQELFFKASTAFIMTEDDNMTSIVVGPPLKPPSHA